MQGKQEALTADFNNTINSKNPTKASLKASPDVRNFHENFEISANLGKNELTG